MQVKTTLEDADYTALETFLLQRSEELRSRRLKYVAIRAAVVGFLVIGAVVLFSEQRPAVTAVQVAVTFVAIMGAYLWLAGRGGRKTVERRVARVIADERRDPLPPRQYRLTEEGIAYHEEDGDGVAPWGEIAAIVLTGGHIFAFPNDQRPYILPRRAFPNDESSVQFYRIARERWMEHHKE